MTKSDTIREFLKYASPRLDYIENSYMEKSAGAEQPLAKTLQLLGHQFRSNKQLIGDWLRSHPYAAPAAAAGTGGYLAGKGSGRSEGADTAASYYRMREFLMRQQLQNANDSALSRLANVFGGGQLSNLIG